MTPKNKREKHLILAREESKKAKIAHREFESHLQLELEQSLEKIARLEEDKRILLNKASFPSIFLGVRVLKVCSKMRKWKFFRIAV